MSMSYEVKRSYWLAPFSFPEYFLPTAITKYFNDEGKPTDTLTSSSVNLRVTNRL